MNKFSRFSFFEINSNECNRKPNLNKQLVPRVNQNTINSY